ncbi:AbrB/MazE/SpoVT family DNA-binding domain-containing protein [Desulfurivibrio sp. C05AmB]|jgi:antitoxin PrlF|uniref:AbrB/MazE/SpoVT family DNA-binding domain-containing protein n=1 Tax=Desulfurivibrio sp. C05AmB TaxID=3374371 RepID=UPI00376EDE5F
MRITSKGQVTIPREVREKFGLLPHTEIEFRVEGNTITIHKSQGPAKRGRALVERMRGRATIRMSTAEIMALTRGE